MTETVDGPKRVLYNGESKGFAHVVDGYLEFGQYSIAERAVPDLRDGLKPVQRRILLEVHDDTELRKGKTKKSIDLIGRTTHRHPHGEGSIYEAMVRMTDNNGTFNVPLLLGGGNMSKVYLSSGAAAPRYTKVGMHNNARDFFSEMDGVTMIRDEAEEGWEPSAMPVRYPYMLCVQQQGLAVSVNTQTPSFNFWDVLNLTESYIRKSLVGEQLDATDIIYPDFATGGHYIVDNREALKVMMTGQGSLRVRSDVDIVGKEIHVNEIPVGTTIDSIIKKLDTILDEGKYLKGVQSKYNALSGKNNTKIVIVCRSLKVVQDTLLELYGLNVLQTAFTSRMIALKGEYVVLGGVYNLVGQWVDWRKSVVIKDAKAKLLSLADDIRRIALFIELVSDDAAKARYLELASKVSKRAANKFLLEEFAPDKGYLEADAEWVSDRKVSMFLDGGTYRARFETLNQDIKHYEGRIADVDSFLLDDIAELRKDHAGDHKRKTALTKQDYRFTRAIEGEDEGDITDTSPAWFTMYRNGFLKKTRDQISITEGETLCQVYAPANSTLIGFTSYGQVVRVYGEQIPFQRDPSGAGLYVPKYLGLDIEAAAEAGYDEFNILYMGLLDGKDRMLLFADGKVSFLTTSKWTNVGARHKIVSSGVNAAVLEDLVDVIHERDFPEHMVVVDSGLQKQFRYGIVKFSNIRRPKGTVGQAQVFKGGTGKYPLNINQWAGLTNEEAAEWINADFTHRYTERVNAGDTGNPQVDLNFDLDKFVEPSYSSVN